MIAFFPDIYPDELLYSQLARYHSRSGYARYVFTVADIYNNEKLVHPNVDFVNRYTTDAMKWITKNEPWEVIAEQHTMYPAYIRFLPKLRRIDAVNAILSCEGNWKNLMCMPLLNESRFIRYCPECAKEDRGKYGETYWHREHQIPRIRVCPKHRCFLENSEIAISAKTSPGLHDAENNVPSNIEKRVCNSEREIEFTQYVSDVMHESVDIENPLSIGKFLHSRLGDEYVRENRMSRNMKKLYEDYLAFYGTDIPIMSESYMQKIFNGYNYDPYYVLQLAFFMGISVQGITHLPTDIPLYGIQEVYQELAQKHHIDYSIVEEIGSNVLKYFNHSTRFTKKTGPREIKYAELDAKYLPQVKETVKRILEQEGRPQKISFAKVQKALGTAQKQFNKLPQCKAYIEQHMEAQPEHWARVVEWAIDELRRTSKPLNTTRIMKLTNIRFKDIQCCYSYIKDEEKRLLVQEMLSTYIY